MSNPDAALATQLKNIESRTGKTLAQMKQLIAASGMAKHGEIRSWLMAELGLGYGDANTVVHLARQAEAPPDAATSDPLDAIYTGAKAALRQLHDAAMARLQALGPFEIAPKKSYLSLRRKKQFAMLGPATKDQLELGLNAKELPAHPRLKALPPGGMCQYTVRLSQASELDDALMGWARSAYESAG